MFRGDREMHWHTTDEVSELLWKRQRRLTSLIVGIRSEGVPAHQCYSTRWKE